MSAPIVTVDSLLGDLKKLSDAGYGDMKIKCLEDYLHEDELGYNYVTKEVVLRGAIYNLSITDRVEKFKKRINEAVREFYQIEEFGVRK